MPFSASIKKNCMMMRNGIVAVFHSTFAPVGTGVRFLEVDEIGRNRAARAAGSDWFIIDSAWVPLRL